MVPFGKAIPRNADTTYYTLTGVQECDICKGVINQAELVGSSFFDLCNAAWPAQMALVRRVRRRVWCGA